MWCTKSQVKTDGQIHSLNSYSGRSENDITNTINFNYVTDIFASFKGKKYLILNLKFYIKMLMSFIFCR